MKRTILVFLVSFVLGFFSHALFFPDFLSNGILLQPDVVISNNPLQTLDQVEPSEYIVEYKDGKFSRTNITVPVGRYFVLINKDENSLMDVVSTLEPLSTPRPYGLEEQVRLRLDSKGQYYIQEKDNEENQLVITVK